MGFIWSYTYAQNLVGTLLLTVLLVVVDEAGCLWRKGEVDSQSVHYHTLGYS